MRVRVDRERCVGSGNCAFWAPATFTLDDEGLSVVRDPPGDAAATLAVAAEGCPARAISLTQGPAPAGSGPGA